MKTADAITDIPVPVTDVPATNIAPNIAPSPVNKDPSSSNTIAASGPDDVDAAPVPGSTSTTNTNLAPASVTTDDPSVAITNVAVTNVAVPSIPPAPTALVACTKNPSVPPTTVPSTTNTENDPAPTDAINDPSPSKNKTDPGPDTNVPPAPTDATSETSPSKNKTDPGPTTNVPLALTDAINDPSPSKNQTDPGPDTNVPPCATVSNPAPSTTDIAIKTPSTPSNAVTGYEQPSAAKKPSQSPLHWHYDARPLPGKRWPLKGNEDLMGEAEIYKLRNNKHLGSCLLDWILVQVATRHTMIDGVNHVLGKSASNLAVKRMSNLLPKNRRTKNSPTSNKRFHTNVRKMHPFRVGKYRFVLTHNANAHFFVVVFVIDASHPDFLVSVDYYDSLKRTEPTSCPTSIWSAVRNFVKIINKYIFHGDMEQRHIYVKHAVAKVTYRPCPQQDNTWDCGLFAVVTAMHLVQDVDVDATTFTQDDIKIFRDTLAHHISGKSKLTKTITRYPEIILQSSSMVRVPQEMKKVQPKNLVAHRATSRILKNKCERRKKNITTRKRKIQQNSGSSAAVPSRKSPRTSASRKSPCLQQLRLPSLALNLKPMGKTALIPARLNFNNKTMGRSIATATTYPTTVQQGSSIQQHSISTIPEEDNQEEPNVDGDNSGAENSDAETTVAAELVDPMEDLDDDDVYEPGVDDQDDDSADLARRTQAITDFNEWKKISRQLVTGPPSEELETAVALFTDEEGVLPNLQAVKDAVEEYQTVTGFRYAVTKSKTHKNRQYTHKTHVYCTSRIHFGCSYGRHDLHLKGFDGGHSSELAPPETKNGRAQPTRAKRLAVKCYKLAARTKASRPKPQDVQRTAETEFSTKLHFAAAWRTGNVMRDNDELTMRRAFQLIIPYLQRLERDNFLYVFTGITGAGELYVYGFGIATGNENYENWAYCANLSKGHCPVLSERKIVALPPNQQQQQTDNNSPQPVVPRKGTEIVPTRYPSEVRRRPTRSKYEPGESTHHCRGCGEAGQNQRTCPHRKIKKMEKEKARKKQNKRGSSVVVNRQQSQVEGQERVEVEPPPVADQFDNAEEDGDSQPDAFAAAFPDMS